MRKEIICGLDIGTSKISAVLGKFNEDKLTILAKDKVDAEGLERGKVLNMEEFSRLIDKVMQKVSDKIKPSRIIIGISNDCIKVFNYRKTIMISEKSQEIKSSHVERLINEAIDTSIPFDYEVLHVFPREFRVDGQGNIRDPRGMFGNRLSADFLFITSPVSTLQNIKKGIYNAGYDIDVTVFSRLASAFAFLNEEERLAGVLCLEIGGGLTSIVKFMGGIPVFLEIVPFGGMDIDVAIAKAFAISLDEAKELKESYGSLYSEVKQEKIIMEKGGKELNQDKLVKIIREILESFLFQIKRKMEKAHLFEYLPHGIVVGGGTFLLEGLVENTAEIFRLPLRLGTVKVNEDLSGKEYSLYPWADVIGLLYFDHFNRTFRKKPPSPTGLFQKFIFSINRVLEEYF